MMNMHNNWINLIGMDKKEIIYYFFRGEKNFVADTSISIVF